MEDSAIKELFRGASVFVTGGTGFLGKLLLEKLLRACPDIKTIFLLMRSKKGKAEAERFAELFDGMVFESMKNACPNYADKVTFVSGDCGLPELGLEVADRELLCREVQVVFHIAATVRFDEKLKTAVNINVRGTKHLLQLARDMPHLQSFIHVSTAYANCHVQEIKEQFYEPSLRCDEALRLVDVLHDDMLTAITPTILGKWPNTYTFTKAIAEDAVREYGKDLPVAIVRPGIVISTAHEPLAGWINNVYGATGVVLGAGLGLLRSLHCDQDIMAEVVPADLVINTTIAAAWDVTRRQRLKVPQLEAERPTEKLPQGSDDIPILNYISSTQNPISWGQYMKYNECGKKYPTMSVMWYYCFQLNKYRFMHNLCIVFLHFLPALIVDMAARLVGKQPILWNAYKKIHRFVDVIAYFSTRRWKFTNDNVQAMWRGMRPIDQELFNFNIAGLKWQNVFENSMLGLRLHVAQETLDNLESARKRYRRLKIMHYSLVYLLRFILLCLITWVVVNVVL